MTTLNPVITHLQQNSSRISRMLTVGQKSSQAQTAGDFSPVASNFGGQKFQLAAQKMRVLDLQKMGRNLPGQKQAPQLGTQIQARFADSAGLLHLSARSPGSDANWARVNMVYPRTNPVERSQPQVPDEPGILRQGSIIPKFSTFPAPGQTAESFKAQVQREAPNRIVSTRKPTRETPPAARVGPRDRLFSRVQEMTSDSKEPEKPRAGATEAETNKVDVADAANSPSPSNFSPGGDSAVQRQTDPVPAQPKPPVLAQLASEEKPTKAEEKPAPANQTPGGSPAVQLVPQEKPTKAEEKPASASRRPADHPALQRQADPFPTQPKPLENLRPAESTQLASEEKPTKAEEKPAPASQPPADHPALQRQADPFPAQPKPLENLRPAESAQLASEEKPTKAEEKPAPASQPEVTEAEIDRASLMPAAASSVDDQPLPALPDSGTVAPVAAETKTSSIESQLPLARAVLGVHASQFVAPAPAQKDLAQAKPVQKKSQAKPVSSNLPQAKSTRTFKTAKQLESAAQRLPIARPTSVSDSSISSQSIIQRQAEMSSPTSSAQPTRRLVEARPQTAGSTRKSAEGETASAPASTPKQLPASSESGPMQEVERPTAQPLHQRFEYHRLASSQLKAIQPAESFVAPRANPLVNRTAQPLIASYQHFSSEDQSVPSSPGERQFINPSTTLGLARSAPQRPQDGLDLRQPESHPLFSLQTKPELPQTTQDSISTLNLAAQPNPMELARTAQAPILDATHSSISLSNDPTPSLLEMTKPGLANRASAPTDKNQDAQKNTPSNVVQRLWDKHDDAENIQPRPGPSVEELAEKILPLVKRMMAVEIERSGSLFR